MSLERPVGPILNGLPSQVPDTDPEETQEWLDSLDAAIEAGGRQRARYLMLRMLERAGERHVALPALTSTDFVNTIPTEGDAVPPAPGSNPGAPMTDQVRDALDQAAHRRQQRLLELESAGSGGAR